MGANVLAVVSGKERAELVKKGGADVIADSGRDDLAKVARAFAPKGLDAVWAGANGRGLEALTAALIEGGSLAYPHGVQPEPTVPAGKRAIGYDGNAERSIFDQLNALVVARKFDSHLFARLPLDQAAEAHRMLGDHHLGRMVLTISER